MEIRTGGVIIQMKEYDLWLLAIALKKYIFNEAQLNYLENYDETKRIDFVDFVKMREWYVFKFLEATFEHLKRPDLYIDVEEHLQKMYELPANT